MKQGIITKISPEEVTITMECHTACHECHAQSVCQLKDQITKTINIPVEETKQYKTGQRVFLDISPKSIKLSLFFAYIFPLIIMLGMIFGLSMMGYSDDVCAVGSILSVIIYFVFLRGGQQWLKSKIHIQIKENSVD